ncbi:MAG: DMT family transporter [Alsobacter sp.]
MQSPTAEAAARLRGRERLIGIALMCGAVFCFSGLDSTAKYLSRELPTQQIVWARYFASLALTAIILNPVTQPGVLRTRRLGFQLARSGVLFGSTLLNFVALRYLQLAETVSITFFTPLLVALLGIALLGERLGRARLAAIAVGFIGVLVVVRPGASTTQPAVLLSVASCFCYAAYSLMTRQLAGVDSAQTTLFYSGLAGVVLLTPVLPVFWKEPPSTLHWVLMASMGVYATVGHFLMIKAHHFAPAGVLSPFMYTQLLWMVTLGWLIFGDVPDHWTVAGGLIVVASGLYLLSQERRPKAKT